MIKLVTYSRVLRDSLKDLLTRELSEHGRKKINALIFSHRQGDPDAICAASALAGLLKIWSSIGFVAPFSIDNTIIAPQGLSLLGERVCKGLSIEFVDKIQEEQILFADLIFVVDVSEQGLLEPFRDSINKSSARKFLIDHHSRNVDVQDSWKGFDVAITRETATSTCEIIALEAPIDDLNREIAQTLLVGLLFDSQHLGIAKESTLEAALALVRKGAEVESARELLKSRPDRSEIIARIKSAQRLQHIELGNYQIIKTEVSSYHASVARMLVEIGGDVGMAYGEVDEEARMSVRSSNQFYRRTNVDIGSLLNDLASLKGLTGGGHPTAASISGAIKSTELADAFLVRLRDCLPRS